MIANVETALGFSASGEFPPARAFGSERSDLDFDFEGGDRTALATAIVAACAQDADHPEGLREQAWALPVGTRVTRLLRIAELTIESNALSLTRNCAAAVCGRTLEISLPFARLLNASTGETILEATLPRGEKVRLRRPTGRDQLAWQARNFNTQREALTEIVQTLIISGPEDVPFDDEAIATLAGAMEEFDPLTAFRLITTCPYCGVEATFAVDLEVEVLRLLAAHRSALLRDVYALATQYGWNEAEIIALPLRRRAEYLRIIEVAHSSST